MRRAALAIAVASACSFAFSGTMAKYLAGGGLSPMESVWVRMAGSALLLVGVLALFRPGALRVPRPRLPFVLTYSVVAVAGVQSLYFAAVARLPVGIALLIEYTSPVLVVLWVRFVRRVRLPRAAYLGAVVAVTGLAVVVEVWTGLSLDPLGLVFAFGAAACGAGYFLLSDGFGDDIDPLGLIAWGLLGAAVVLVPISRPWDIPWRAFTLTTDAGGGFALPVWAAALWLIAVATVAAYILGVIAIRRLSAAVGSTVGTLEVIIGAVVAWLLAGEALGFFQIAGGVVVLAGAYLAQRVTGELPQAAVELPEPARAG
ncbi:EamA family transporter [Streptosporangium sp. NPDC048047]|uniref:EamA family transporter n=1 Tax=Streptosporangium sp. NPDC048047 TaxID=3155748 RepID=UPI00343B2E31